MRSVRNCRDPLVQSDRRQASADTRPVKHHPRQDQRLASESVTAFCTGCTPARPRPRRFAGGDPRTAGGASRRPRAPHRYALPGYPARDTTTRQGTRSNSDAPASSQSPLTVSGAGDDGGPHVAGYPKPQMHQDCAAGCSTPWTWLPYPHRSGHPAMTRVLVDAQTRARCFRRGRHVCWSISP